MVGWGLNWIQILNELAPVENPRKARIYGLFYPLVVRAGDPVSVQKW